MQIFRGGRLDWLSSLDNITRLGHAAICLGGPVGFVVSRNILIQGSLAPISLFNAILTRSYIATYCNLWGGRLDWLSSLNNLTCLGRAAIFLGGPVGLVVFIYA